MTNAWTCAGLSFAEAVERYADTVTRLCLVRMGARADVEDCFQNVFLRLWQHPPKAETPENLKAWLITVTVRETVSRHRWWHSDRHCPLEELPIAAAADTEARELLTLLLSLPSPYRETLYLHYYEGYRVEELASLLKRPAGTVKSHLSRGRDLLKSQLTDTPSSTPQHNTI